MNHSVLPSLVLLIAGCVSTEGVMDAAGIPADLAVVDAAIAWTDIARPCNGARDCGDAGVCQIDAGRCVECLSDGNCHAANR